MTKKGRVFSGARPTGRQHLGNYLGAVQNYVALQKDYDCVYCVVDLHALTTMETTLDLKNNTYEMALDWLAAGIRPEESIVFIQSNVPQVTELHTILSMVTPLGKLTDLPTFKEKIRMQPHNINYGLVGYPVLMTADIVLYKADVVPVGIDQAPHLEFARETVRSFNFRYNTNVLIEPQMRATEIPKVIGIDGVQLHGAIGFTAEYDAQLYLKRSKWARKSVPLLSRIMQRLPRRSSRAATKANTTPTSVCSHASASTPWVSRISVAEAIAPITSATSSFPTAATG